MAEAVMLQNSGILAKVLMKPFKARFLIVFEILLAVLSDKRQNSSTPDEGIGSIVRMQARPSRM